METIEKTNQSVAERVNFKALLEGAPNLYLILLPDENFTIVAVSDSYAQATMTERNNIVGRGLFEVFPDNPDDPAADGVNNLRASLNTVVKTKRAHTMADQKYDIRRPDGSFEVRYWSPKNSPVFDDKKKLQYIIHRVEDVTEMVRIQNERREAEQALQASEKRFRKLLESAPDAMVIVNATGEIVLVNLQAEKIFGYKRKELIGQKVELLMPHRFATAHKKHRAGYAAHPQVRTMGEGRELKARRKDGSEFSIEISLSPIEMQEEIWVSAAVRDITERKKIEEEIRQLNTHLEKRVVERTEELEATNKELEQFAYIASHDLQEPLRMVNSFLQLLQKKYDGLIDAQAESYINFAIDGSERMKRLILDLLEYSRIGSNNEKYVDVDVNEVVKYLETIFKDDIVAKAAKVKYKKLPTLRGNKTQLTQLFQNLISNSLKYKGAQPPVIEIKAEEKPAHWQFSFTDNGIGIDERFFNKIFIVFQRLHNNNKYSGTGIGLALCKKIVECHKGKIWVQSTLGKSTTFYFTLAKNI